MEWMYKNSVDDEDYLLGRRIGKSYAEDTDSKEIYKKTSHRDISADNQFTQVDESKKLLEDPLIYIKKKELESKKELLKNPIKLKRLQEAKQSSAVIVSSDSNSTSHTLEYCLLVTNAIWSILKYMPDTINIQSLLEYVQHKRASNKQIKGSELYRKFCRKKKKTITKPNCKGKSKQKQQKPIVKTKHKIKAERSSVDSKENAEKASDRFVTVISSSGADDGKRISRNTVKRDHQIKKEYRSCSNESYNDKHCRRRPVKDSDHGSSISHEDKYTAGDNERQYFYSDSKSRDQQQHHRGHRPAKRSFDRSLTNKKKRSSSSETSISDSSDSRHSTSCKPQIRISQYKKQHGEISDNGKGLQRHGQQSDSGHRRERHAVYSREHDRHHGLGDARYRERVNSQHRKRSDDRRHERSDVPYRERSDNRRHECHRDGRRSDNEQQARHHEQRGNSHRPSYDHSHDREQPDDGYRREKDDNSHKRSDRYIERIVITRNFAAPGNTSGGEDMKRKSNRDTDRYDDKHIRKSDDSSVHSGKMQQSRNTKVLLDNERTSKRHKEASANISMDVKNDSSRQKLKDKEEKRNEMLKNAKWRDEQQSYSKACMKLLDERTNSREPDKFKEDFAIKMYSHALSESSVESRIKSNIHNVQKLSSSHKNDFVRR